MMRKVVEVIAYRPQYSEAGDRTWEIRLECGHVIYAKSSHYKQKQPTHCRCRECARA